MKIRVALSPRSMRRLRAAMRRSVYNRRVVRRPPAKRVIRPHKGGRSESFPGVRASAETLSAVRSVCDELGITVGDWIEAHAASDAARLSVARATGKPPDLESILGLTKAE